MLVVVSSRQRRGPRLVEDDDASIMLGLRGVSNSIRAADSTGPRPASSDAAPCSTETRSISHS